MTTVTADYAIDAFVDAGLECRDQGVLPEAVAALIATGALDELLEVRWVDDHAFQRPRRPAPRPRRRRGCLLGRWLIGRRAGR